MRLAQLRYKEIINVTNGHRLGYVSDVEMDIASGQINALVVPGPARFFGLLGREEDYVLPFDCIERIGSDIILIQVSGDYRRGRREKQRLF